MDLNSPTPPNPTGEDLSRRMNLSIDESLFGTGEKDASGNYTQEIGRHTLYIKDFTIFSSQFVSVGGTTTYYMYFDDLILLISSLLLLLTRKWWFVIGYTIGWYTSSYMHLYTLLKLPIGPRDHY